MEKSKLRKTLFNEYLVKKDGINIIELLEKFENSLDSENSSNSEDSSNDGSSEDIESSEDSVYTVTFMYNGIVFGTQEVKEGELASKPKLKPAPTGSWNYDFSKPITEDTIIEFLD